MKCNIYSREVFMFLILIIAFTCTLSADESRILGQSPRNARIYGRQSTELFVSGSIMPATIIPKDEQNEVGQSLANVLTTTQTITIGTHHRITPHMEMMCSIGAQISSGHFNVPVLLEGKLYLIKGKIRPFLTFGVVGMIGKQIGLFSTIGIGLNIHLSRKVSTEIQYRRIRGSVLLNLKNDSIMDLNQNGVLFGVNLLL